MNIAGVIVLISSNIEHNQFIYIYKENGEEEVGLNHRHRCTPNDAITIKKKMISIFLLGSCTMGSLFQIFINFFM